MSSPKSPRTMTPSLSVGLEGKRQIPDYRSERVIKTHKVTNDLDRLPNRDVPQRVQKRAIRARSPTTEVLASREASPVRQSRSPRIEVIEKRRDDVEYERNKRSQREEKRSLSPRPSAREQSPQREDSTNDSFSQSQERVQREKSPRPILREKSPIREDINRQQEQQTSSRKNATFEESVSYSMPRVTVKANPLPEISEDKLDHKMSHFSTTEKCDIQWEVTIDGKNKDKKKQKKKQKKLAKGLKVPKGCRVVESGGKKYIVKKYEKMSREEQEREMDSFEYECRRYNELWKKKNISFRQPDRNESLVNVSIRHQQYLRLIKSRVGSDVNKLLLVGSWVVIEAVLRYFGIPAKGYVESQLDLFDMYQDRLILLADTSMDGIGSIGQDWSPWTWICIISVVNMAILVGMNWMGNGQDSVKLMKGFGKMISSGNVSTDENGTPLPKSEQQSGKVFENIPVSAGAMGPMISGAMNIMMNAMGNRASRQQESKNMSRSGGRMRSETRPQRRGPTHA